VSDPTVVIRFDGNGRVYCPQEVLAGEYWLPALPACHVKAIEVSVLWYTEGKGDEDFAVHEFWRRESHAGDAIDPSQPTRFQTTLPHSPLSYEGQIVKLRWCVRVRAFLHRGKEVLGEKNFRLGEVPPPKALTP
jgi:hypothetical protein